MSQSLCLTSSSEGNLVVLDSQNVVLALSRLDGRTFQLHRISDTRVKLYPVEINDPAYNRCPVIINGERCGERFGHTGKHCWSSGD